MNISTKFQLHPPYSFRGDDSEYFFANLAFRFPWQPIKFSGLDKIHMVGRGWRGESFENVDGRWTEGRRTDDGCMSIL